MFLNTAGKFIVHLVKDRKVKKKKNPHEKSFEERNFYKVLRISVPPYSNCKKSSVSFMLSFLHLNLITCSKEWVMKHFASVHVMYESPQLHQGVWEVCPAVLSDPEPRGLYLTNRRQGQPVLSLVGEALGAPGSGVD